MKALFAIKSLAVAGGGAERVLTQVASALSDRGHEIVVLTFDGSAESFYPLSPLVQRCRVELGNPGESIPRVALMRVLPRLRRMVRAVDPDVVVGFMHSMYIPLGIALVGTGYRRIASEHIGMDHYMNRPLERAFLEIAPLVSVSGTIPSEHVRAGFPPRLRRNMAVMPNPISFPLAAVMPLDAGGDRQTILAVGRLASQKGQADLVHAFSRLADEFPSWDLRIVGEGDLRNELEEQIDRLGLSSRVALPGVVRDVHKEYRRASVVAVPSLYESFGLVTAEALACGRPVVGYSDCPGTNELIRDGVNGLLVAGGRDRAGALAHGLRRLMRDAALRDRLGLAGPDSVAGFGLDAVVDRWEDLLVLASDRGP